MRSMILRAFVLSTAAVLAACGGSYKGSGSSTSSTTPGGTTTTPGTTPTGIPASLTLTASPGTINADGTSTSTLTAKLIDTAGQPMSGTAVTFSTNAGTISGSASPSTDATGTAIGRLLAGTIVGRATVTAREPSSGLTATTTVSFIPGAASQVVIVAAPTSIRPAGTTSVAISVTDANGNPVSGEVVSLDVSTNTSGGALASINVTTDVNGRASTTYTAGTAGTPPFNDTLRARLASGTANTANVSVNAAAAQIASISMTVGDSAPVAANTVFTVVRAVVTDSAGQLVSGAIVSFSSTSGAFSSTPGPFTAASTATTDPQGVAQIYLRSPTSTGNATVRATTGGFTSTQFITFVAGTAVAPVVTVAPAQVRPAGTATVDVTVNDANGNPVSNQSVTLSASTNNSGGTVGSISVTTDVNGRASTTYTAGTTVSGGPPPSSVDTIQAKLASGLVGTTTLTVTAAAAQIASISMTVGNNQPVADQTVFTVVRAVVTDTAGQLVSGAVVDFSATSGVYSSTPGPLNVATQATTDAQGTAQLFLQSPTSAGSATVRTSTGGFTANQSITYVAGPAANITILANPTSVPFNSSTLIRATVTDANGNRVPGENVSFSVAPNSSGGLLAASTVVTDASGVASTSYQAGTQAGAATDTVTARVASPSVTAAQVNLTVTGSGVPQTLTFTSATGSIPADGSSTATLTAKLVDTTGLPVGGATLTFTTNAGALVSASGAACPAPCTATTAGDGTAVIRLKSGTITGRATVTASHTASGLSANVGVSFVSGAASTVTLSLAPTSVRPGGTATVDVSVADASGNPVSGELVTFNVATNSSGGQIATASTTTDGNGRATTTYSAGTTTGTDQIEARLASGQSSGLKNLIVSAAAAQIASVTMTVGDSAPVADSGVYTVVRAVVTDTAGQLVNGAVINFSSTSGTFSSTPGPFTTPTTADMTTNAQGTAQLFLESPNASGSATVRASTSGFTATQAITFVAGPATSVVITATPSQMAFGQSSVLRATVTDAHGNAVPNEGVTFKITQNNSGGTLGAASVLTDAGGQASSSWQAGAATATTQVDQITASIAAGVSSTATLNITASVGSFSVTSANAQIVADGTQTTTVKATVRDRNGSPVSGASVTCTTNTGTIPAGAVLSDSNGESAFTYTSPTIIGNAVVLCGMTGLSATTVIQLVAGPVNSINVVASPSSVTQAGTSTITATALDVNNNVVANEPVSFSFVGNGGGFTDPSNGTLSTARATTDASGRATTTYSGGAPNANGPDRIQALTAANKSDTVDMTVSATAQVAQKLAISVANSQSNAGTQASVQVATAATVRATVTDQAGGPIKGVDVTFTTTAGNLSGGTVSAAVSTSDANGNADVTLNTPNFATSGVIVTASVSGLQAQATVTVVPGPATAAAVCGPSANLACSVITANPTTLIADGQSTTTVTVVLNDAEGNPVADGRPVTLVLSPVGGGAFVGSNSATTLSGRATFTLQAPTSSQTTTVAVQDIANLSTPVTFASPSANTTGDPASIEFVTSGTTLSVAGVGQTEQLSITATVRDSAGNVIDEKTGGGAGTGYNSTTFNNLHVQFVTQPHGGETITGKKGDGTITSSSTGAQFVDVRTNNGVAVLTLHSGTIPGIMEIKFTVKAFDTTTDAATASLPQVSVASGPPHTIAFTHPVTGSIENLGGGSYRRRGQAVVTDRYGNHVPDGTVINLSLIDSVMAQGDGGTIAAGSPTITATADTTGFGGNDDNLLRRACGNQPPAGGGEASGCTPRGDLTGRRNFFNTLVRNNASRGIQGDDHIYVLNADGPDKARVTAAAASGATTVDAQSNYLFAASQPAAGNGQYWIGASLLGGFISGCNVDDSACGVNNSVNNASLTTGSGVVYNGIVGLRVTYPANVGSLLLGCYGYESTSLGSGTFRATEYNDKDRRDAVPQSRQVVIGASAGNGATGIDVGEFCFAPIAGSTLTPSTTSVAVTPQTNDCATTPSGCAQVSLELRDGGDKIHEPYVPLTCAFSQVTLGAGSTTKFNVAGLAVDKEFQTDVSGFGYVYAGAQPGASPKSGDSAVVVCSTTGGFETATASFTIKIP